MKKLVIITSITILFGLLYAAFYVFPYTSYYGSACEASGGKWASELGECITRDCYRNRRCGRWSTPGKRCHLLKVGDAISEVYFQLGEPDKIDGAQFTWPVAKMGENRVVAIIEKNRLVSINCNSNEQ